MRDRNALELTLLLGATLVAGEGCAAAGDQTETPTVQPTFEVLALSRGRGVPAPAAAAFEAIAAHLQAARASGDVVSIDRTIIGLEGETRLCALFRDSAALAAHGPELKRLAAGADLLQLEENGCVSQD